MAKLWQRTRDEGGKSRLHEVSLTDLHITSPSIIFLTGFFTMDDQPGYIAGALKSMEEIMEARPGEKPLVNLYAWSHSGFSNLFNLASYDLFPTRRFSAPAETLAWGVILPLVAKDFALDGEGNPSGTPLPLEEAKKNLRNVTFFGYSAGTITGQECFNASLSLMKKIGWKEDEARDALHEVVMISTGNISRPTKEKNRFTQLYLAASNDLAVRIKNRLWRPLKTLFQRFTRPLTARPLSVTSAFISASVSKKKWERVPKGDNKHAPKKIGNSIPLWLPVETRHELPRYITQDENFSPFAKMVQYALTNATVRAEHIEPLQLLEPPAGVEAEAAKAFRDKIAAAAVKPKS